MPKTFEYSRWRHGGWYVHGVQYASGAIGCVSRNYDDGKWRIVCDSRPFEERPTFKSREEAARAEYKLAEADKRAKPFHVETPVERGWARCGWIPAFPTEAEANAALERELTRGEGRQYRVINAFSPPPA